MLSPESLLLTRNIIPHNTTMGSSLPPLGSDPTLGLQNGNSHWEVWRARRTCQRSSLPHLSATVCVWWWWLQDQGLLRSLVLLYNIKCYLFQIHLLNGSFYPSTFTMFAQFKAFHCRFGTTSKGNVSSQCWVTSITFGPRSSTTSTLGLWAVLTIKPSGSGTGRVALVSG